MAVKKKAKKSSKTPAKPKVIIRHLPVITMRCGETWILEGGELFEWICWEYNTWKKKREYYDLSLPFDYLEKVKERYEHHLAHKVNYFKGQKYPIKNYDRTDDTYKTYMNSVLWKSLRKMIILERVSCERCNSTEELHVHHLNYNNFMHEEKEDLMLLCHKCHCIEHGRSF